MNDEKYDYLENTVDEVEDISSRSWLCKLPLVTRKPPEGYIFLRPISSAARSIEISSSRALEELDALLLRATRNDPGASVDSMKTQTNTALNALDSLLKTVPSDVLDKGKVAADSYRSALENADVDISDPELKELQSIL